MSVESLIQENYSSPDISEKLQPYLAKIISEKDYPTFGLIFELLKKHIFNPSLVTPFIRYSIEKISQVSDPSERVDYSKAILFFLDSYPAMKDGFKQFEQSYISDCQKSGKFFDLVRFYEANVPSPGSSDNEMLEYYLNLVEANCKASNFGAANTKLVQASSYRFALRTPKNLLEKFDLLYSEIQIGNQTYENAAERLFSVSQTASNEALFKKSIERAMIFAVVSPPSRKRTALFSKIMNDERASQFPVFSLIERLSSRTLIEFKEVEVFWNEIQNEASIKKNDFINTIRMHNLGEISTMYSTVSFKRLGEIIGSDESEVLRIVDSMISANRLNAKIDQPNKILIYNQNPIQEKDISSKAFCDEVEALSEIVSKK